MRRIKIPVSTPFKLICLTVLIVSSILLTAFGIKAEDNEQRIAILPFDTEKAGDFAYLGPAIEEILNSRLYKPGIISIVNQTAVHGPAINVKKASEKALADAAKEMGAGYFVTGKISSDGKTPELTLQLIDVATSKSLRSLSLKNALSDDIMSKIDGFVAETADAIITIPQTPTKVIPGDAAGATVSGVKAATSDIPQKQQAVANNALAVARVNPDVFFYKKLNEITARKDNTTQETSPEISSKDLDKLKEDEKEAKRAYESVLPYPAPSEVSKDSKKTTDNKYEESQLATSLEKAARKDDAKFHTASAGSAAIPYPTPEEIEARDALTTDSVQGKGTRFPVIKTPQGPETQIQPPAAAKSSWFSWIPNPFKTKKQHETQAFNKPSAFKDNDGAMTAAPNETKTNVDKSDAGAEDQAAVSDGPIWQWY